jgi:hypothetical protein
MKHPLQLEEIGIEFYKQTLPLNHGGRLCPHGPSILSLRGLKNYIRLFGGTTEYKKGGGKFAAQPKAGKRYYIKRS